MDGLLVNYSDSDSEKEVDEQKSCTHKCKSDDRAPCFTESDTSLQSAENISHDTSCSPPPAKKSRQGNDSMTETRETFSLPSAILDMFDEESERDSNPDHQGRVRSFAHVRGNWATHVFVSIELTNSVSSCVKEFMKCLQRCYSNHKFHDIPHCDLHVSLSRTVPIQHHWIEPLMDSLRTKFKQRNVFTLGFGDIAVYVNDEGTRSFVGLDVVSGHDQVYSLVQDVDQCFAMYRLQEYYKDPSFHVSLYWCLGSITEEASSKVKSTLQEHWEGILEDAQTGQVLEVVIEEVRCKTGNKIYSFPLSTQK